MPSRREIKVEEETSLRLRIPSMRLNRNDVRNLWQIVEQVRQGSTSLQAQLYVSGNQEHVFTRSIDKLIRSRWPQDVDILELSAEGDQNSMMIRLENRPVGVNRVEIIGTDSDWVSARAKEVDDFVAEHRSWYWIFHTVPTLMIEALVFAGLVGWGANIRFGLSFENAVVIGAFGLMLAMIVQMYVLRPLYPFMSISGGERSNKTKARGILNWVLLTVVGGLFFNALSVLWTR